MVNFFSLSQNVLVLDQMVKSVAVGNIVQSRLKPDVVQDGWIATTSQKKFNSFFFFV